MKYSSFDSKTVLITGASKGIGKAIAEELLESNCKLILTASSEKSFENFSLKHENISFLPFDMSDRDQLNTAIEKMNADQIKPDILINNAGVGIFKNFKDLKTADFDKMIDVNFRSPYRLTQAVLPNMLEKKFGVIANILSVAAINNFQRSSAYGATKAALLESMKTLRLETRSEGIKVINFLPGATETSIWSEKVRQEMGSRMMQPENLAKTIVSVIDSSIVNNLTVEEMIIRPQGGDL